MKKILLIAALIAAFAIRINGQQIAFDGGVLASGIAYHYADNGNHDDRILHYYVGYFGHNVLHYCFQKTDMSEPLKQILPLAIMTLAAGIKEATDKHASQGDIMSTLAGCYISIVRCNIKF
ncbi:MAG: hypothetical protein P4L28_04995 [Paludibacteraceae bacterium]|nr:hypothetical protein [Paludibacteraceae bacterium]